MAEELSIEEAFGLAPNNVPAAKEKEFSIEEAFGAAPVVSNEPTAEELETASKPYIGYNPKVSAPKTRQKQESVLQNQPAAPIPATEDRYVVNPELTNKVQRQLDAMPAEQRNEALAKMAKRPDVYGRVAKAIIGRNEALDQPQSKVLTNAFDPRIEARTQSLINQGMDAEAARNEAWKQSLTGEASILDQMQATPEAVTTGLEKGKGNTLQRAASKTRLNLLQNYAGINQFVYDALGVNSSQNKVRLDDINQELQAIGKPKANENLENALVSLGSNIPNFLLGFSGAGEAAIFGNMFAQSFGQNYAESRGAGLDASDSAIRSAANAYLEVLGERLALGKNFENIKASLANVPTKDIVPYMSKALVKEVPGELLTYAGNYGTDVGFGMQKPSWESFIQGGIDTILTTLTQGGILLGANTTLGGIKNKVINPLVTPKREGYKQDTSYEGLSDLIARSKGFLTPAQQEQQQQEQTTDTNLGTVNNEVPGTQTTETTVPAQTAETTVPAQTTPPLTKEQRIQNEVERLQTRSIPADAALQIATERVNRQEQAIATQPVTGRIEQRTQELIASGVLPTQALAQAIKQIEAEDLADQEAQGEINAARPNAQPPGTSVQTSEQPTAVQGTTTGTQGTQRNGVVFNQQNAPSGTAGKGQQPTAVSSYKTNYEANRAAPIRVGLGQYGEYSLQKKNGKPASDLTFKTEEEARAAAAKLYPKTNIAPDIYAHNENDFVLDKDKAISEAAYEKQKLEARSVGIINAQMAFDQKDSGDYESLQHAIDSHEQNVGDTLVDQGLRKDPNFDYIFNAAHDAFKKEVERLKGKEQPVTSDIRTEVQALTTPAKRGRKATPEKTAANKAKRNEITKQNNKVDRTELPKIINDLKEATAPINEDLTLEEAKQAEIDRGQKKRSAIRKLIELSEHPLNEKNSATDKRISAVLNNRNIISQQEIDNVRRGMKVSGQALANKNNVIGPVQSKFLMKTTGRPNNAFKKAKTGQEALDIVKKTGTKFEKFLATRLKPFLKNVEFVVLEDGEPLPDELNGTRNGTFWTKSAQGLYVEDAMRKKKIIYVRGASGGNFQGINNTTVLHEAWHAATNLKILMAQESIDNNVQLNSPLVKAYQDLEQVIENAVEEFKRQAFEALDNPENKGELPYRLQAIYDLIKNGPIFEDAREFVSYALTDEDLQDFLMDVKGFKTNQSLWSKFVDVGRRLLGIPPGDNNALSDMLVVSNSFLSARATSLQKDMGLSLYAEPSRQTGPDNDLTDEEEKALKDPILEGIQALDAEFKKAMDTFQKSEDGAEAAKNASLLQALRDPKRILPALNYAVKGMSSRTLKRYVRIPPVSVLASNTATAVPRITEMYKNVQNMKGMTHSLLESGAKIVTLIHKTQTAQPGLKDKLNRVAFMSTLMKYDPSNPNNKIRNVEMDNMYKALGAEGQFVYKHVKEYFEDLSDYFSNILDEQIKNSGLPAEEQEKLMAKIRQMYEASKKIDPYFPLVRFGSYWLRIGEGDQKQFFMFESSEERDAARDELAPKYKGQKIVVGDSLKGLREDNFRSSEMLKEIFGLIDRTSSLAEAEDKEAVKDAVYQIFLTTMPEQSFRNQFISRKGLAGFSPDFQRSVAQAVTNMGTQLPRLKYAPILRNQIAAARQAISERHRYAPFVDEMERRIRLELSPPQKGLSDKFANGLNTATYIYYLSAAKSAIIQPTSVFQLGFAQLSKKHGYVAAAKELTSFLWVFDKFGVTTTNLDGSKSFVFPSITESNKLTPKEKEAVRLMVSRNVTQSTYANAIFNFRTTPTDKLDGPAMERLKGTVNMFVLGGLMGSAERLSREIVYLASYRLNIKAKLSHEAAIDMAVEDVNESLGDYDSFNRAPWMKSAAGKIFTPFDMYPITVTVYLIKNFTRMLPLLNKEGKVEALRAFFGALGTTWIWAGVVGLPSYSIYMGLLGLFWKKHEKDKPNDMRGIDYRSWFESKEMPRVLGELSIAGIKLSDYVKDPAALALRGPANYMTGLDFSSSTSLNDLWFRQTKETKNMHDEAMALALEKAGASVNMLVAEAEGISELMDGNYQKAAEKMLPASLRGPVVAAKWVREGVKDNKGDVIIKKGAITPTELIGKVINFNPDILSNAQEMTFRFYAIEQRVQNERQKILDQLDAAYRNNDSKTYAERYKEMEKFNIKYSLVFPEYEITQDNIVEAFDTRAQQRAQSWNGVTLSEKNAVAANEILKPSRKAIVERVKKTQGQ